MSFRCILDLSLFLDRFRNIDLYQQGLYSLKFSLTYRSPTSRLSLKVFDFSKADFAGFTSVHSLMSPSVAESGEVFVTGVFLIRYTEEEAILRELAVFRLELDYTEVDLPGETILTCALLYTDLDCDYDPPTLIRRVKVSPIPLSFQEVSTIQYRLHLSPSGFQEFLPISFDETHKCLVSATIHCLLVDYVLRNEESRREQEDLPSKLAKTLFVDRKNQPKLYIGGGEIDKAYREYVGRLAHSHTFLRSILSQLATPDLTVDETTIPGPLSLPILQPKNDQIAVKFSEAVWSHDPVQVATALFEEIATVSAQILHMFRTLQRVLKLFPGQVTRPVTEKYWERVREKYGCYVKRTARRVRELPVVPLPGVEAEHCSVSASVRSHEQVETYPVTPLCVHSDIPVLFEESYIHIFPQDMTAVPSPRSADESQDSALQSFSTSRSYCELDGKKHVFVLVHGFQGRPYDVHLLKQAISMANSDALVLSSCCNEKRTEGCVVGLGERLANEVRTFVGECCPGEKLGKLSFVGHSMGGLVIRAAIPHLVEFADKMHLFLTLSTPHLGYMYNSSKLIDAGIWVLKKWKRSTSLQQLSMTDDHDMESTALFTLSTFAGLRWFQHVVFCSSYQDQYVPHDSSRVEVTGSSPLEEGKRRVYVRMAANILSQISLDRLFRIDVNFKLKGKGLDSLIGRTAHIQFLENEQFVEMIVRLYPHFFV